MYAADGRVVGAGFLVGERHILTCAHVIAQALDLPDDAPDRPPSPISLDFPQLASHTLLTAEVVFWYPVQTDGRGDIAVLKLLDKPPVGAKAVHFAPAEQIWEHPYRAFGFPARLDDGVWSNGRLLGRQGTNWIQLEDDKIPGFAVIAGFSGTPVWDEHLQGVVGMIVAASQPVTAKVAFAIPSDVLVEAWSELAHIIRPPIPRNPYKGLHAFTELDSRDFFGREALIHELVTGVETALTSEYKEGQQARMLTVVLGPSGSGKSSVVMAGLLPNLHDGRVLKSNEWVYLDPIFPGAHPLETLAVSLAKRLPGGDSVSVHEKLASASVRNLHLLVSQLTSSPRQKVVLLLDQFEEVFILTTDEAERRHFFELLEAAVTEPRGPLFVILTLRADFYDRPMQYPELFRLIDNHHVSVLPLGRDELRQVIEQPANLPDVQVTFESGLVDELLLDMQGQSGALPLLEFTLDQLFQRRNGHQLTMQAYHEMGGVKGALSQHAEQTYLALPSDAYRQAARDIFLRLIEPGTTGQDTTRRRADRSEFERADSKQAQQMRETLEAFIKARLVTTNKVTGRTIVEVSHEALIREWSRLAGWLRDARDDIPLQQTISKDAAEWEQRNKPRDRLYRGSQLKEAQAWARRNTPSGNEVVFLHAGATSRMRVLVSVFTVVLLVVSTMGVASWVLTHQPAKSPDPTHVTNLQDDGVGSLRWAITNAPARSTITFDASLHGPILLSSDNLDIAKNLKILGPGADKLSISESEYSVRVLQGAQVTISDLTFNGGRISNSGTLTLSHSTVSGNTATGGGGIHNSGTLTLSYSTVSGNIAADHGGGIYNDGVLTLTNSTVSGNKVTGLHVGGGIYNQGTLTLTNSTISGNTAFNGGGIYNFTGTLTLNNSTISDNEAYRYGGSGGGILIQSFVDATGVVVGASSNVYISQVDLTFSTIYGNTAHHGGDIAIEDVAFDAKLNRTAIKQISRVKISNSIVAGDPTHPGPDIVGMLNSNGYNLFQDNSGATFNSTTHTQYGPDKILSVSDLTRLFAKPVGLGDNGGPTKTIKLNPDPNNNPAVDRIPLQDCQIEDILDTQSRLYTDQRSVKRPDDGNEQKCDIGAYESP
jgi:hypothetical protein